MFTLLNVYNTNNLIVQIHHDDDTVDFDISMLVSKRSKEELDPPRQYALLNAYVDYKGEEFKRALMNRYKEADDVLMSVLSRKELNPLPLSIVHNILDMFDQKELFDYCKNVYGIKPPKQLINSFNTQIEIDGDGTRAQTYLKDDFIELAALNVALKAVLPVIGQFGYFKRALISGVHTEYILFNFIITHPIYKTPAMIKLLQFIEVLVAISFKKVDLAAIRVIEKRIAREEMALYILSSVVFNKISIATMVDDFDGKNVITRMHNYVHNKLNVRKDVSSAIRAKKALSDTDGTNGEKESLIESYRSTTDKSVSVIVEINWVVGNINTLMSMMDYNVNPDIVNDAYERLGVFHTIPITKQQRHLLSFIFKDVIDPRSLVYLERDSIINLLAVGFAYLWETDSKYLAILLTSYLKITNDDIMTINTTVNRTRLSKELKDQLMKYYPYTRVINNTTNANVVEETINSLSNEIYTQTHVPTADMKYIKEVVKNKSLLKIIPADLKHQITVMLLRIEKRKEKEQKDATITK